MTTLDDLCSKGLAPGPVIRCHECLSWTCNHCLEQIANIKALQAEAERLRAALDLALGCKGALGVCDHCRAAIGGAS